ncbi:MAG: hypothetical protein R3F59_06640 [Myxococcota bacterium]
MDGRAVGPPHHLAGHRIAVDIVVGDVGEDRIAGGGLRRDHRRAPDRRRRVGHGHRGGADLHRGVGAVPGPDARLDHLAAHEAVEDRVRHDEGAVEVPVDLHLEVVVRVHVLHDGLCAHGRGGREGQRGEAHGEHERRRVAHLDLGRQERDAGEGAVERGGLAADVVAGVELGAGQRVSRGDDGAFDEPAHVGGDDVAIEVFGAVEEAAGDAALAQHRRRHQGARRGRRGVDDDDLAGGDGPAGGGAVGGGDDGGDDVVAVEEGAVERGAVEDGQVVDEPGDVGGDDIAVGVDPDEVDAEHVGLGGHLGDDARGGELGGGVAGDGLGVGGGAGFAVAGGDGDVPALVAADLVAGDDGLVEVDGGAVDGPGEGEVERVAVGVEGVDGGAERLAGDGRVGEELHGDGGRCVGDVDGGAGGRRAAGADDALHRDLPALAAGGARGGDAVAAQLGHDDAVAAPGPGEGLAAGRRGPGDEVVGGGGGGGGDVDGGLAGGAAGGGAQQQEPAGRRHGAPGSRRWLIAPDEFAPERPCRASRAWGWSARRAGRRAGERHSARLGGAASSPGAGPGQRPCRPVRGPAPLCLRNRMNCADGRKGTIGGQALSSSGDDAGWLRLTDRVPRPAAP